MNIDTSNKIHYSWDNCIKTKSKEAANVLIEEEIIPSRDELNKICQAFGRNSSTFSDICYLISHEMKNSGTEDVICVLPSYRIDNGCPDDNVAIVFVVMIKKNSTFSPIRNYECYIKHENEFNDEGQLVAIEERDDTSFDDTKDDILEQIRIYINERADDFLTNHSNLNVIIPSLKKSTGYNSSNHIMYDEPCIALYVSHKGYIPLHEEPFETEIGGFKIDVLEGEFEPFHGGPNEYHENIKIGLAIHGNVKNGEGILGGTLGGFVDHSVLGMCGITCAHVVFNNSELIQIKETNLFESKIVYQPIGQSSFPFGEVVHAIFKEGDQSEPGIEVALIKIQSRQPNDGSFPEAFNDIESGFDTNNPLCYNSGEVCEASQLKKRTEVYKFGMSSGITRGSFALQGAIVRKQQLRGHNYGFGFNLKNQIVILQIGENSFAEPGDSGSLVLMEGDQDSVAVGIVEGGMSGRVFVTPICDILRAVGLMEMKMYQFTKIQNPVSVGSSVNMETC